MRVEFTKLTSNFLDHLNDKDRTRIVKKIEWLSLQSKPFYFAKPLVNMSPATHRFRVGMYRITASLDEEREILHIYDIGIRSRVYKKR